MPGGALNDLLLPAALPHSLEGSLGEVTQTPLPSRHALPSGKQTCFQGSGTWWGMTCEHLTSGQPLTFHNTPFLPAGVHQDVVSQLSSGTTFHHQLLRLQKKQIWDKECVLFFLFPLHQIISTRALYILNVPSVSVSPVQCGFWLNPIEICPSEI